MTDYINVRVSADIPLTQLGAAIKAAKCELKFDAEGLRIDRLEIKRRGPRKLSIQKAVKHPVQANFGPPEDEVK